MAETPATVGGMKVRKYRDDWTKRVFSVGPEQREALRDIAVALGVTFDGAARLALRHLARERGLDLPGFDAIGRAQVQAFVADGGNRPRIMLRFRSSWLPVVEQILPERTFGAALRLAITTFHAAGAEVWRAALTQPAT